MPTTEHEIDKQIAELLALSLISGVGGFMARQLISYCGSPQQVFKATRSHLLKIPGVGPQTAENIIKEKEEALARSNRILESLSSKGYQLLHIYHANYPQRLKSLDDAPLILFFQGNISLNFHRSVAIVGTRKATEYGKYVADQMVAQLVPYNPVIISGLAYGIDVAAHKAALEYGLNTLGVMASGLDIIYPAVHKAIASKMLLQGGLVTEYPPTTKPEASRFPARNRIIAALADAVVVVESAAKGGGLVTAGMALDYGKEVFAVPGRITDKYAQGCNELIEKGEANLYSNADELAKIMGWHTKRANDNVAAKKLAIDFSMYEVDEVAILKLLESAENALLIDDLARRTNISINKMAGLLLNLEFKGAVQALPGNKYKLTTHLNHH